LDKLARILAVVAWCALENSAFAQTTPPQPGSVTNMPYASTPLGGSELLYIVQGGVSKKISTGLFLANLPNPLTIGTTQVIGGTPNYLLYVGGGGLASQTQRLLASQFPVLTGDCTTAGGVLAITCTKTGGVAFAPSATTDTTNASNITSSTIAAARLPAATSGAAGAITYSAGAWTPGLAGTATAGSPTYTLQVGSYEQIGRLITVRFAVAVSALGSPTGNMTITGIPFAAASTASDLGMCFFSQMTGVTLDSGYTTLSAVIAPGASTIGVGENGSGQTYTTTGVGKFAAATTLLGYCSYHT
jgi:hypothetical protein